MSNFNIELIKLNDIVIRNAYIENKTELLHLDKGQYKHDINYTFEAAINLDQKRIRITFVCEICTYTKEGATTDIKGSYDIAFIFVVENLQELVHKTDSDELNINEELLLNLSNIVYATSRGIIYTRCQGTILKNAILPILPSKRLAELISKMGK